MRSDDAASALLDRVIKYALPDRPPAASAIWLQQRGEIRSGPDKPWMPFTAKQWYDVAQLQFRWEGRVRMNRLMQARVVDGFLDGHGLFEVRLFGIRMQRLAPGADLDAGELGRLLAELPWCPLAYGNPAIEWTATDDHTLAARMHSVPAVAAQIVADRWGRVLETRVEGRGRQVGKMIVPTPCRGTWGEYRDYAGLRLPASAEAYWIPPEGEFAYWRGEVVDAGLSASLPA